MWDLKGYLIMDIKDICVFSATESKQVLIDNYKGLVEKLLYRSVLGISVYHRPGDMHKLTKMILDLNKNYKVYMRHYTNVYADTVCYLIPDEKSI